MICTALCLSASHRVLPLRLSPAATEPLCYIWMHLEDLRLSSESLVQIPHFQASSMTTYINPLQGPAHASTLIFISLLCFIFFFILFCNLV